MILVYIGKNILYKDFILLSGVGYKLKVGGVDFFEILINKKKKKGEGWVGLVIFMVMLNFVKRKRGRMVNVFFWF